MARKCGCFEERLSKFFCLYGRFLARHPFLILSVALVSAAITSCGVVFLQFESNSEDLFTPDVSRARNERTTIQSLFPTDFDNFSPSRVTELNQRIVQVIATARDDGNVLEDGVIDEAFRLREMIVTTRAVNTNGTLVTYEDLCAQVGRSCPVNPVLQWIKLARQYNQTEVKIPYPLVTFATGETVSLEFYLGGVHAVDGLAESAKALAFFIYLRHEPEEVNKLSGAWEDAVAAALASFESRELSVVYFTSDSIDEAQEKMTVSVMSYFSATFIILILFAVATCMMKDWVLSKPWLASSGAFSAVLAILCCIGILSFSGVALNQVAASMPFLIVGIGLDDTFIMLAAWRKTDPFTSVEERMGEALSEAAVSITITTVTDFLAFCTGSITPLPAVRVFCLCAGIAVVCDFFFQLTFFGAVMVLTGRREAANRHCYFCCKVVSQEESPSALYSLFCAGGYPRQGGPNSEPKPVDHVIMTFFRDSFAPLVTHPFSVVVIGVVYIAYLLVAIYGCCILQEGLEMKNLAEEGSVTNQFFVTNDKYFIHYGPTVSVMIIQELEYWDMNIQQDIEELVLDFESSPYSRGRNSTDFWLRAFLAYAHELNVTITDRETFNSLLMNSFLQSPQFSRFSEDIVFDDWGAIIASRFLIGTMRTTSTENQGELMVNLREIADCNTQNLTVQVYAPNFTVFEQFLIVLPNTLQNLFIATLAMLLVSLLLIPNPLVSAVVTLCVVSIETGVVGFMSHWGVNLDGISMINIILCIGFSVDFSAHISYSFVTQSRRVPARERAAYSLYSLGYPILQSAASTILGISALFFTRSYIFHVFAKVLFLVMTFGLVHGLLFLPALLTVLGLCGESTGEPVTATDDSEEEKKTTENGLQALMHIRESNV